MPASNYNQRSKMMASTSLLAASVCLTGGANLTQNSACKEGSETFGFLAYGVYEGTLGD